MVCLRTVHDFDNPGQVKTIEVDTHDFAWSGKMPCTGQYRCVHCGMVDEHKVFLLGRVVATAGVKACMDNDPEFKEFIYQCVIERHKKLDWGQLCEEDKELNESSLNMFARIQSSYEHEMDYEKVWIITEADRSLTTVLFPSEY
jgi:hypothetical protein